MYLEGRSGVAVVAVVATTLLLAACSHHTQQVGREMVLPPTAVTHTVESNQRFLMAAPIHDPDPSFPDGVRLERPARLCAAFTVDGDGVVDGLDFDRDDPDCAEPETPVYTALKAAVTRALREWRYFGAAICTFPEGQDPDRDPRCEGDGVQIQAVPIRLRYVFTFSGERGGHVSRATAATPR